MRRFIIAAAAVFLVSAGALATAGATTASAAEPAAHAAVSRAAAVTPKVIQLSPSAVTDCKSGYVCIFPGQSFSGTPSYRFYTYGVHTFSNQFGYHYVYNHQTGGALAKLCTGSNGTNCGQPIPAGDYVDVDLTPYNSIVLYP